MEVKKGPWSEEDDQKLIDYVNKHGHGNWHKLPKEAGLLRCGKSCRLRWANYLRPDIKRGSFSSEEDQIIQFHHVSVTLPAVQLSVIYGFGKFYTPCKARKQVVRNRKAIARADR
ncbi:hypothetical protein SUGI_0779420 [Cryptomeria japonica]|nr:hypothetical protein SUGI_0779420 [Cryptomeria japonica]